MLERFHLAHTRSTLPHACNRRQGFTLIELLVVISIIAMLMAVLLPALQSARQRAVVIVCQTGLRGMYLAHTMYMLDYHDRFFPAEMHMANNAMTSASDNRRATWWGTGYPRTLIWNDYVTATLEYEGDSDGSRVTDYTGAGRCPTASDDFIYSSRHFPLGYNANGGLGQGLPVWGWDAEQNYTFYLGHARRNWLRGTNRTGFYRDSDLMSPTSTVPVFYDHTYSNRRIQNGWSFGFNRASGLLHDGVGKLNIIMVDGSLQWYDEAEIYAETNAF